MTSYNPIIKNGASGAIFYVALFPRTATGTAQANPTLATGDVTISLDGGAFGNLGTLPDAEPNASKAVRVILSQAETNADNIVILFSDAAGAEWCDLLVNLQTVSGNFDSLTTSVAALPTAAGNAAAVWDLDATAHQTQGTFGQAIGDPVADTNTIFKATVTDATGVTVGTDTATLLTRMGTPSDLGGGATLAFNLSDIESQTDDIGVAGAGLTNINLPDQTMNILGNITGDITGSLSGSVGSVGAEVDANVTSVNGIAVTGSGTTADPWGP